MLVRTPAGVRIFLRIVPGFDKQGEVCYNFLKKGRGADGASDIVWTDSRL